MPPLGHRVYSLGNCHSNVVDRQSSLPEQIFAHVRQRSRRIDGVAAYTIALQVGSSITTLQSIVEEGAISERADSS